jgi:hypothetical protein
VGGISFAFTLGIVILAIYILSFCLVPSWTAADTVMRFQFTTTKLEKKAKSYNGRHGLSWFERASAKLSKSSASRSPSYAEEKRFFEVGDEILWRDSEADVIVGTVESTTVYHEQDADELGDFDVFVKIHNSFKEPILNALAQKADKPVIVMTDSNKKCRCLLKTAPATHARLPLLGWQVGPWEIVRQINACFQLLLMSLFPAVDTISDLVYILSSPFANPYIFAASLFCITGQFWLYVKRLKQRRVFEAVKKRRIDLTFLYGLQYWPKWASADSLPVYLTIILPIYFVYFVIFPIVWFLLGYALYSFQLFPISRISNRWLYAFVYVYVIVFPTQV